MTSIHVGLALILIRQCRRDRAGSHKIYLEGRIISRLFVQTVKEFLYCA